MKYPAVYPWPADQVRCVVCGDVLYHHVVPKYIEDKPEHIQGYLWWKKLVPAKKGYIEWYHQYHCDGYTRKPLGSVIKVTHGWIENPLYKEEENTNDEHNHAPKIYDERIVNEFEKRWGFDMSGHILMACYVGSISHGTNLDENSLDDVDMMAIIVPPIDKVIGIKEWTHDTIMIDELDVVFYSARKYMGLLMKANPNVVGTLFLEQNMYMWTSKPWHKWMIPNRSIFSTMEAYGSFCGYASSQLARLQRGVYHGYMGEERKALVDKYGYDIKNAAHVIRLYRMGIEYLETGNLKVYRPDREQLKAIKRGEWTLEQVLEEAAKLDAQMKKVKDSSVLVDSVDMNVVNDLLVKIHTSFFRDDEDEVR